MHSSRTAFTLLELSIVMAVIALVAGGIIAGSTMIRSAEIRNTMRDINAVREASNQFKIQYRYLPGDMPNATQYWGALNADPAICQATPATGTATCNGNGNGVLETQAEQLRFWQHLANGKFIKGTYTGTIVSAAQPIIIDVNTMSLTKGLTFQIIYGQSSAGDFFFNNVITPINLLQLASPTSPAMGVISPGDAYRIDEKMDDGKPAYGIVLAPQSSWPSAAAYGALPALNCTTSDTPANATYNATSSSKNCVIGMVLSGKPIL
jgi:prepilin-type N-terminal cleavage/methylation domain-containing protein